MDMHGIDLANFGLQVKDSNAIKEREWSLVGKELLEAFTTTGFACVVNHGIERRNIDELNEASNDFFSRSAEYKMKFHTKTILSYDPVGLRATGAKMSHYNEGIRFPCYEDGKEWPDVPHLKQRVRDLQQKCKVLLFRILKALGVAMNLKDADLFQRSHGLIGEEGNLSRLKLIFYPPVTTPLPENYTRFREHKDIGSVSFLFRDGIGGLQLQTEKGDFVDVPDIPDSIVLNIGQMMEIWTGGKLKAAVHRVIVPKEEKDRSRERKTIAYFAMIDSEVLLDPAEFRDDSEPLSSIQEEKPVTAGDHAKNEMRARLYIL